MDERGSSGARSGSLLGPRLVAVGIVLLAAILIYEAFQITKSGGYSVIGASTFPLAVSVGLLILGIVFLVRTTAVPDHDLAAQAADEEAATDWPTVGILGLLLIVYAVALDGLRFGSLTIPGLGYILATGLFLPVAARALGSRHLVRDLVIGFIAAFVIYLGFTQYLGVRLPAGVLGGFF